jgi:hypothetical protein
MQLPSICFPVRRPSHGVSMYVRRYDRKSLQNPRSDDLKPQAEKLFSRTSEHVVMPCGSLDRPWVNLLQMNVHVDRPIGSQFAAVFAERSQRFVDRLLVNHVGRL